MKKLQDFLHDLVRTALAGGVIACVIFALFFLIGLLVGRFQVQKAMVWPRGALFISGALLLLVSGGMLIRKPNEKKIKGYDRWKDHYRVFGIFSVFFTTAVTILIAACLVDYALYY